MDLLSQKSQFVVITEHAMAMSPRDISTLNLEPCGEDEFVVTKS